MAARAFWAFSSGLSDQVCRALGTRVVSHVLKTFLGVQFERLEAKASTMSGIIYGAQKQSSRSQLLA